MSKDVRVKVTAYKKFLIIEALNYQQDEDFIPNTGGNIGCLLFNTKKNLGISKEAMNLLKEIKRGGDDLGDLTIFKSKSRGSCFGWLGQPKKLVNTENGECELSRDSLRDIEHVTIENKIPLEALEVLTREGE